MTRNPSNSSLRRNDQNYRSLNIKPSTATSTCQEKTNPKLRDPDSKPLGANMLIPTRHQSELAYMCESSYSTLSHMPEMWNCLAPRMPMDPPVVRVA